MKRKKSARAYLENKRGIFLQAGFIIVLSITLIAFEWESPEGQSVDLLRLGSQGMTPEEIVITNHPDKPKTAPPMPPAIYVPVKDSEFTGNDPVIISSEVHDTTPVAFVPLVIPAEDPVWDEIFVAVEEMPEFRGGDLSSFHAWVQGQVRYPEAALIHNVQGTVYIRFVVNRYGAVENIVILKGADPALDEEAIRVISSSPRWKPGRQSGRAVSVLFTIPIKFRLL